MTALPRFFLGLGAGALLSIAASTEAAEQFIAGNELTGIDLGSSAFSSSLLATLQGVPEPTWLLLCGLCLATAATRARRF